MTFAIDYGWYLWLLPVAGIVVGIVGRRYRWLRYVLAGLGPVYAIALFVLLLIGSVIADIGAPGMIVIAITSILSLSPIVSTWLGSRAPSVLATIALAVMTVLFVYGLLLWLPSTTSVLAAAIAGPPRSAVKPAPSVSAGDDPLDAL